MALLISGSYKLHPASAKLLNDRLATITAIRIPITHDQCRKKACHKRTCCIQVLTC